MDNNLLERIEVNPAILVGKPVIKGTRLSVQFILSLLAQGETEDTILKEYSGLTRQDILACLFFASQTIDDTTFLPVIKKTA